MVVKHALVTQLTQHTCPHTQVSHILLFKETKMYTLANIYWENVEWVFYPSY